MKTSPMQTVSKESWGGYINIKKMFKTKSITKDKERMQWEISYSKLDLLLQIENGLLSVVNIVN